MKERLTLDEDRELAFNIIIQPDKYDYEYWFFIMGLYETLTIKAPRWVFEK